VASRTQQPVYSVAQLEQLWTGAGGDPSAAPLMAAIALSESGGNPWALNNDPATGDYSVGLWQINYYGGLLDSRTARYGSPSQLRSDPQAQAKAAVDLYAGGRGLSNWQTDAAYSAYQARGQQGVSDYLASRGGSPFPPTSPITGAPVAGSAPARPGVNQSGGGGSSFWGSALGGFEQAAGEVVGGPVGGLAGGIFGASGSAAKAAEDLITDPVAFLKAAAWLVNPLTWLRAVEAIVGIGLCLVGIGVVVKVDRAVDAAGLAGAVAAVK
jgi:hypothetical protein